MAQESEISTKSENVHFASVKALNIPLSRKFSIEIGNYLRYKNLSVSKDILRKTILRKSAIPFKKYNRDLGHKPGISSGRFPIKASNEILKLLDALESNAENKNLDTKNLVISEFIVNKGNTMWHYGRKRRRKMKRCHIFIKCEEKEVKND